ncbi:transcription factor bHLH112-like isoform X2 [Benincasa hispida]|uniref:transcription factor bHLH112-like isoform X2 n=1 Tax=Benincasa hispida TaxID=102211 RepID=UPI0018FF142B|nr:transcription factor bHLH112-like isoform X2 [Benincasa hispida]
MDVPSQMVNNYGLCLESKLFNNDGQLKLKGGGFTIPCQHPFTYQPGCNASISTSDNISPQSILFPKKVSSMESDLNAKKHELFTQKGLQTAPYDLAGDYKRMKLQVPVRRSQRLSDKVTALQKLVSPFGKTDTASVLQEACLYIKFVQEHIQNLLQMQSSSYKSQIPEEIQQKQRNLRSEGLCLVPVTLTQKIAINKDKYDPTP